MGSAFEIVPLAEEHEAGLRRFVADFRAAGEEEIPGYFAAIDWPHAEIVRRFAAWSRGEELAEDWVPCTTLFLVERGEVLGVVNVRHALTDSLRRCGGRVGYAVRPSARGRGVATAMLEHALVVLAGLGVGRALVTTDRDNPASSRVVEKCGGVFQDEIEGATPGIRTQRCWIET